MRSPVEKLIADHRAILLIADKLVDLLAPSDIATRLLAPEEKKLRLTIAENLEAIIDFDNTHFRIEEELIIPSLGKYVELTQVGIADAVGCMIREHTQMHMLSERAMKLAPLLHDENPPDISEVGEILRTAYAMQSVLRHHCLKEEREVYPLLDRLTPRELDKLTEKLGMTEDIPLDHLIRPMGTEDVNPYVAEDGEAPEN
jgi:hemerythrin-like domain-containing protein